MIDELSIIIPTLNEERYLPKLLDSIRRQTYAGKLEVIVVDGRSKDGTIAVARSYRDRFKELQVLAAETNVGHQRNVGVTAARYRYLLFLDADVVLPPDLLAQVARRVDGSKPFVVSVNHTGERVTVADRVFLVVGLGFVMLARGFGFPPVIGDFLMTSRAAHDKVGGFVEGALLGEDSDYGFRAVKAGARYHFFWRLFVIGSDRRIKQMGRAKLLWTWARGYVHVIRRGPVFPGEGYVYPFGHYDDEPEKLARRSDLR